MAMRNAVQNLEQLRELVSMNHLKYIFEVIQSI